MAERLNWVAKTLKKMEENKIEEKTSEKQEESVEETKAETKVETEADPKLSELEAKNRQLFERAKKAEDEAKALKLQHESLKKASTKSLDVEDYIDISASLEGLDQREKSYLAEQHKLTGKPLTEIRQNEDFQLWQSAYQAKVAKEKALKPSGTQEDSGKPLTVAERLARTTDMAEKEKILTEAGYYKSPRPKGDRSSIGGKIV